MVQVYSLNSMGLRMKLKFAYSLVLQLPRHRLDGCACKSPLAHFYIHHAESSVRELHPFTTITHLASQNAITPQTEDHIQIQFLFRKRGTYVSPYLPAKNHAWITALNPLQPRRNPTLQWTDKLASLADEQLSASDVENSALHPSQSTLSSNQSTIAESHPMVDIGLRLEGPYFTPADPSCYNTVVCFVAGTGVSGAIAIAGAFIALKKQQAAKLSSCVEAGSSKGACSSKLTSTNTWERCVVFWSVRADDYVELPFFKGRIVPSCLPSSVILR